MPEPLDPFPLALRCYAEGRFQEAEQACRQILDAQPTNGHAWYLLGSVAFKAGDFARALQCFGNTVNLIPGFADARNNLGLALAMQGDVTNAASSFRAALDLKPDHAEAHFNLANVLNREGKFDEAADHYRRAIEPAGETTPAIPHASILQFDRLDTDHGPFMDTAAIMKTVDLVITSDTSVAHLAGALAVPVWVALPLVPDWRWLLDRTDSPWYPTMRLFRQKKLGDWTTVFDEIKSALAQTALG